MLMNASSGRPISDPSSFSPGNWLSTICYRSRATSPLSDPELDDLVRTAQTRNRVESITGMVVYDDGRFMQWLEGPTRNLDRIVDSINRDGRHTDIEILGREVTPVRMFEGWDLKLARKHPLLVAAASATGYVDRTRWPRTGDRASGFHAPAECAQSLHPADPTRHARDLANRLLSGSSVTDLIASLAASAVTPAVLFRDTFEPVARVLGDLWAEDMCTEFDVTIALVRLQSEMRRLNHGARRSAQPAAKRILVVPQPGEPHMLSAALGAEILWQAGWGVICEFPETDSALQALLSRDHFDALDLSLSPAMSRWHRLQDLARTIAGARKASLNKALAIVARGRVFGERHSQNVDVGADAASQTSFGIETLIAQMFDRAQHMRHG